MVGTEEQTLQNECQDKPEKIPATSIQGVVSVDRSPERLESITEIKDQVLPRGLTNALSIRVSDQPQYIATFNGAPYQEEYLFDGKPSVYYRKRHQKYTDLTEEQMQILNPVKTLLSKLLDSRKFTDLLLAKYRAQTDLERRKMIIHLSYDELATIIPDIKTAPAAHRVYTLLNYGFDPELIGLVMVQFQEGSPLSVELAHFLDTDQEAKKRLEAMMFKRVQLDNTDYESPDRKAYHEEFDAFKNELTAYCERKIKGSDNIGTQLENFFNDSISGFVDFFLDVKRTTAACYFQRDYTCEDKWERGSHAGLTAFSNKDEIRKSDKPWRAYDCLAYELVDYALAVEKTDYQIWLLKQGKKLYQQLFPQVFQNLPLRIYIRVILQNGH